MLISKKINDAINQQIGNEFGASLQYVAIATHFDLEALPQLAAHFYQQAEEERDHAMRFVKFLVDADAMVVIPSVPAPKAKFSTAADAVKLSLDWELEVTRQINALVAMAKKENDYTTDTFLQWFVREQLEEVSSMDQLLKVIQRAGEGNLLRVEEYLARKPSNAKSSGAEAEAM
jgi:bacterioferritin B